MRGNAMCPHGVKIDMRALAILFEVVLSVLILICPVEAQQEIPQVKFALDSAGRTARNGAVSVSFSNYKATDRVIVEQVVERYKTRSQAQQRLRRLLAGSSLALQQRRPQSSGRKDRIQMVTGSGRQASTIIAWTDGAAVYLLRSHSAPHVISFEQQVYGADSP